MPSTQHTHRPHPPIVTLFRSIQGNYRATTHDTNDAKSTPAVLSAMPIRTHKLDIATSNPSGIRRIHNQLISNNTRPGTYQFRESIHKTGVVLRTFHFFPYLFPYLCYLILSRLTPSSFQTRFRLITFIHASALLLTCLFLISFLYLPSPFFYINPVDYACKP